MMSYNVQQVLNRLRWSTPSESVRGPNSIIYLDS